MVAVITRRWAGPIAPAANSAAVAGRIGGRTSPVSDRRGVSSSACSTRAFASLLDRLSTPASSRAVVPNPAAAPAFSSSSSPTTPSIRE
jgi:hypothetical protein